MSLSSVFAGWCVWRWLGGESVCLPDSDFLRTCQVLQDRCLPACLAGINLSSHIFGLPVCRARLLCVSVCLSAPCDLASPCLAVHTSHTQTSHNSAHTPPTQSTHTMHVYGHPSAYRMYTRTDGRTDGLGVSKGWAATCSTR